MRSSAQQSWAPLRSLVLSIVAVLAAVVTVGVGRRTGLLEPELAKRLGMVVFGIMLVVLGNYMPKFVVPWSTPAMVAARRFAGWVFVLAGAAYVAFCLLAPMPQAVVVPSVIGIAAFVLAGVNWVRAVRRGRQFPGTDGDVVTDIQLSPALVVQRAGPHILLGLFFVFVLFLSDALWGDSVARWMAVGYCLALAIGVPLLAAGRRVLRS
jgi:hypothetical protein